MRHTAIAFSIIFPFNSVGNLSILMLFLSPFGSADSFYTFQASYFTIYLGSRASCGVFLSYFGRFFVSLVVLHKVSSLIIPCILDHQRPKYSLVVNLDNLNASSIWATAIWIYRNQSFFFSSSETITGLKIQIYLGLESCVYYPPFKVCLSSFSF